MRPDDPPSRRRDDDAPHPAQTARQSRRRSTVRRAAVRARAAVAEASGLARSSRHQDRTATTRLLLAVFCEAYRCGDDYVVMGVVPTTTRLLFAMFGTGPIRPLDAVVGTVTVAGTGVRGDGVTLIPCYSETARFLTDCLRHCRARPGREFTRILQPLLELTTAAHPADPLGQLATPCQHARTIRNGLATPVPGGIDGP